MRRILRFCTNSQGPAILSAFAVDIYTARTKNADRKALEALGTESKLKFTRDKFRGKFSEEGFGVELAEISPFARLKMGTFFGGLRQRLFKIWKKSS